MRFLVDENIPVEIVEYLRSLGHDVLDIAVSEHRGATDTNLWQIATAENRVIVTPVHRSLVAATSVRYKTRHDP